MNELELNWWMNMNLLNIFKYKKKGNVADKLDKTNLLIA